MEANPYVDEILPFGDDNEERNIFNQLKFVYRLRKLKIDRAYLFHRSATRAQLMCWAGVAERIGYDTKGRNKFLTCSVSEPEGPIHSVQYFLDLLRASGHQVQNDYYYEFYFTPEDLKKVGSLLNEHQLNPDRLVAINPGANWEPKRWPPAYFQQLAECLVHQYGIQIVITGSVKDSSMAEEIVNHSAQVSMVSLCGKTSVRELGALFSKCRLVISNDTGPLHIAAGVGANVIGLFGPTAPQETGPLGRGRNVVIHYFPEGAKLPWKEKKFPFPWMELISVDQVVQTIEKERLLS